MYPLNSIPGRKDVAFIKAKHGKGAAQNGRHSGSCAQAPASRWKQVLLTLLIFIALLALIGGALWQNICYNRTHYTAEFYQVHSRKLTQSCRVVFSPIYICGSTGRITASWCRISTALPRI